MVEVCGGGRKEAGVMTTRSAGEVRGPDRQSQLVLGEP